MSNVLTEDKAPPHIGQLADALADARINLERAKDEVSNLQGVYDAIEADLFEALENLDVRSFRTPRGLFMLNDTVWASVSDEAAARQWAEANMPELITLNRNRLAVVVRTVLKGEEAVPGLEPGQQPPGVDWKASRKINWRRT